MRTKDGAIRENPVRTDGYQMLANAIILQAVQDYRKAKRVLNTYRGDSQSGTPQGCTVQTIPLVRRLQPYAQKCAADQMHAQKKEKHPSGCFFFGRL